MAGMGTRVGQCGAGDLLACPHVPQPWDVGTEPLASGLVVAPGREVWVCGASSTSCAVGTAAGGTSPGQGTAVPGTRPPRWPPQLPRLCGEGGRCPSPQGQALRNLVVELTWVLLKPPAGLFAERIAWAGKGRELSVRHCPLCALPALALPPRLRQDPSPDPTPAPQLPAAPVPSSWAALPGHPVPSRHVPGLLPMWQLWTQMRCPSYLQLHFMALLVKSLSATSKLGLITTCRAPTVRVTVPCPAVLQPCAVSVCPSRGAAAAPAPRPGRTWPLCMAATVVGWPCHCVTVPMHP